MRETVPLLQDPGDSRLARANVADDADEHESAPICLIFD
jgi:hypothetical protein